MRKTIFLIIAASYLFANQASADNGFYSANIQSLAENSPARDSDSLFIGEIYNKEYDVFIRLNFYENDILVEGQKLYGEVSGYIKNSTDSRCWLITSARISKDNNSAKLEIINDYGSEDLIATLSYDSACKSYTLRQKSGSTIKFAKKGKWQKLPSSLVFVRR